VAGLGTALEEVKLVLENWAISAFGRERAFALIDALARLQPHHDDPKRGLDDLRVEAQAWLAARAAETRGHA